MKTKILFSKMHGLGNDFMIIDAIRQSVDISKLPLRRLAHRNVGIGFDQLLVVQSATDADFLCSIYNSDGSEAEQCGNGLRSVASFIHKQGLSQKKSLRIKTKAGIFDVLFLENDLFQVTMGIPCFQPEKIPFQADQEQLIYELKIAAYEENFPLAVLSMGNPHAILEIDAVESFPVTEIGEQIESHPKFPNGVNVGFMEVVDRHHIRLRTFERGVGETFACGSNACAAVVAGIVNSTLDQKVQVELVLGSLWIEWEGKGKPVKMTGPATLVYEGEILL